MGKMGGDQAVSIVQDILDRQSRSSSLLATILSSIFLVFGASAVVLGLQDSINAMWDLSPRDGDIIGSMIAFIKQRLVSAAVALIFGYLLLVVLVINTLWATFYSMFIQRVLSVLGLVSPPSSFWGSLLIYVLIFALTFWILPQGRIRLKDVWPGAALTACLFWVGNYLIHLYFSYIFFASIYGAASSIIVFLLWVNYSSMIVLFGAKFTEVYARHRGHPVQPSGNMILNENRSQEHI